MTTNTEQLKEAIIAEVASDVLRIKDEVAIVQQLVKQLSDSLPSLFDVLKAGLIETLDQVNDGIKEAGGERIDFVRGQLHAHVEEALRKAFETNSKRIDDVIVQFERQNVAAATSLRLQYDETAKGMDRIRQTAKNARFPTWAKIAIPLFFVLAVGASGIVCWQLAAYREAVYMQAFMTQAEAQ